MVETKRPENGSSGGYLRAYAATLGVTVAAVYGAGFLVGNKVSDKPDVDVALQTLIKPAAIQIGRQILAANISRDGNVVITRPDSDNAGEETISANSVADNEWVTVDASMFRDKNGQLDPGTVNDIYIIVRGCHPDGSKITCGGNNESEQEVELIYGDTDTFTHGDWGALDKVTVPGQSQPTLTINTAVHNPTELSSDPDARQALSEARVWTDYARTEVEEMLSGNVTLPKPQN